MQSEATNEPDLVKLNIKRRVRMIAQWDLLATVIILSATPHVHVVVCDLSAVLEYGFWQLVIHVMPPASVICTLC